jgi:hypothetical protein
LRTTNSALTLMTDTPITVNGIGSGQTVLSEKGSIQIFWAR